MKFSTALYLFPVVLVATGCGFTKMPETTDKMAGTTGHMAGTTDHMSETTDRMSNTTEHMSGTTDKMATTTEDMSKTTDKMAKTTDDMSKTTDKMAKTTQEMADGMKLTNAGVHDQELLLSLDDMLKERNTDPDALSPAPFGMFPGGKKFAETATVQELLELAHLLVLNIDESMPEESKKVLQTVKDPDGKETQVLDYPPELKAKVAHDKIVKFDVLTTIATFTPQEKIEQIVATEIQKSGLFEDDAYVFLSLRSKGIKDWLYDGDRTNHLENVKKLERGIEFVTWLDYLATAPFVSKLQFHFVNQLLNAGARDFVLDPWMTTPLWKRLNRAFSSDLDKKYLQKPEDISDPEVRADAAKVPALKAQVQSYLDYWKKHPKP